MSNKYLEVSAATRAGVGSREDRNNAWPRCQRRKRSTGPGQRGRAPSSLDTSGLQRPSGGEHPTEQRHIRGAVKLKTTIASNRATLYKRRTYGRDRDSQIHHDARFGACTQRVAADEIDGSWRGHVELALCRLRHQQEGDPSRAREPRQVAHLSTHAVTASSLALVAEIKKHLGSNATRLNTNLDIGRARHRPQQLGDGLKEGVDLPLFALTQDHLFEQLFHLLPE